MRVSLNGDVISNDYKWLYNWLGLDSFCPRDVRQALEANPEGEPLVLEINSPGGSVFAGFEIYNLLRNAKCETVAEVMSLAGSSASTIASACQTVKVSPVAQVMIHLPTVGTQGNSIAHKQSLQMLESVTESILNGYMAKVNGKTSRDELRQLMDNETWLTAQRAVELGLADGILYEDELGGVPASFSASVGSMIRNAAGGHDPEQLMALYEDLVRSGKRQPAEDHPVAPIHDAAPASNPSGEEPDKHTEDDWRDKAARELLAEI